MSAPKVVDVRFEHYRPENTLGVHESQPRISWRFEDVPCNFHQTSYEIEVNRQIQTTNDYELLGCKAVTSTESHLVPWPHEDRLTSRSKYSVRVRATGTASTIESTISTDWSSSASIEAGLLKRDDWACKLISAPFDGSKRDVPKPEDLFRKEFDSQEHDVASARLYITSHGVYEAEINGRRVGDYFLAPGWQSYNGRLQYQTYDVTNLITDKGKNCIGIRVAEGWFSGRLSFDGGRRNVWADRNAAWAQLEIRYRDGTCQTVVTDESWSVTQGPIVLAEIYDGEKYDARLEIDGWSRPGVDTTSNLWVSVDVRPSIPSTVDLSAGFAEPSRRIETLQPRERITTPSGKTILDFGQNLVGYVRIKHLKGPRGHKITLRHAEVLENGELGVRPLRVCKAEDTYTLKGAEDESYEPRFTFHGFRYLQIEDWPSSDDNLLEIIEAVVCHTDMEPAGSFACSDESLNQLYSNATWSMRGNFLSVPTDCPQRDERLGWTGDLALFAPTATFLYKCYGILKGWLADLNFDQKQLGGVPPFVVPNVLQDDRVWGKVGPAAIWHDVTILAPWALWEATKDSHILERQYDSMITWLSNIPRNKTGATHLWDFSAFQLADWLDPNAPPDQPQKALTDPPLVANAFLVRCLDLMTQIAQILGRTKDADRFKNEATSAHQEFADEYVSTNGRLVSDTQTAYALAICFDLLSPSQTAYAGKRLSEVVNGNKFNIGTGFAGTPFVCEALAKTGHIDVAYAMLLNEKCPSWLYPLTKGATTMWERWDSMLPDGSVNPGEMTSFNHYAFGAVAKFMVERLAGLRCLEPGWRRTRFEPEMEGTFTWATVEHLTPYGKVSGSWSLSACGDGGTEGFFDVKIDVVVPPTTEMEVVVPGQGHDDDEPGVKVVGSGQWSFTGRYKKRCAWPVAELSTLSF